MLCSAFASASTFSMRGVVCCTRHVQAALPNVHRPQRVFALALVPTLADMCVDPARSAAICT